VRVRDDVAPKRAGHGQAMQEDDDRPGAAGVLVLDRSRRKIQPRLTALPSSTGVALIIHTQSAGLIQWERQRARRPDSGSVRIDDLLPSWHFRERHRLGTSAEGADLLAAVERVTWAEVPVMRALMRARSAGRLRLGPDRPILEDMARLGFTMLARTGDELVAAAVGRPWSPAGGRRGPRLVDQPDPARFFVEFSAPGWAKMITNFRVSAGELTTETRVLLTDDRSRRAFRRYWLVIRPFSGLIRRRWLAAIARRAVESHRR
jgi:hypothetical protein